MCVRSGLTEVLILRGTYFDTNCIPGVKTCFLHIYPTDPSLGFSQHRVYRVRTYVLGSSHLASLKFNIDRFVHLNEFLFIDCDDGDICAYKSTEAALLFFMKLKTNLIWQQQILHIISETNS